MKCISTLALRESAEGPQFAHHVYARIVRVLVATSVRKSRGFQFPPSPSDLAPRVCATHVGVLRVCARIKSIL